MSTSAGYRVLPTAGAFWRPSNAMGVLNTDLGGQLESETLGARLWRLAPGQASTKHRHSEQVELYVVLEGTGRMRVGDDVLTLDPCPRSWSSRARSASRSTTPTPMRCGSSSARRARRSRARSR